MKTKLLILWLLANFTHLLKSQDIVNPGFELLDHQSNTLAEAWANNNQNASISVDSIVRYSGKYSMRISAEENTSAYFFQKINIASTRLQKCQLSTWIKQDTSFNTGGIIARLSTAENTMAFYMMNNKPVLKSGDWQKYICDFYLDETHRGLDVFGLMTGKDTVRFDDFNLEFINETSPGSQAARKYFLEAAAIIEEYSLMVDSVDFTSVKENCLNNLSGLESETDCYPIIRYMLNKLGDNHSNLMSPVDTENYATNEDLKHATGRIINENYAYLNIPAVESTDSISLSNFATNLQKLIKELDSISPKGWIVDLRNNPGGNCWPMLAGLGPLLGEGVCGYFINSRDSLYAISYKNGTSFSGDVSNTSISSEFKPYRLTKEPPVAVLIGPSTASSGEIIAISFIGKQNTKLFGEPSYGLTTGNEFHTLSDGATLVLTEVVDADRNKKRYGGKIHPDHYVSFSNQSYTEDNDPVILEAIKWIYNGNH